MKKLRFQVFNIPFLAGLFFTLIFTNACKDDDSKETLPTLPTITSFTPESGGTGIEVVISGKNFGATAAANIVMFSGEKAKVLTASATALKVTVPEKASSGKVTVTVNGETATSEKEFTVVGVASIISFTPESGEPGTEVLISGKNFQPMASDNTVKINGIEAEVVEAIPTQIKIIVPEEAETGKITITANDKTATSEKDFVVLEAPVITGFSPESGSVGTKVTITGNNFGTALTENIVTFNGIVAEILEATATSLQVVVPEGATDGKIAVSIDGQTVTTDKDFTIDFTIAFTLQVAAGNSHTLSLKSDNTLWACGKNEFGQLGDGTTTSTNIPKQIMEGVKYIDAGEHHTLFLKEDNTLWACGNNGAGQLGDGTTNNVSTPKEIMGDVMTVSTYSSFTLILKTDHTLWATGSNYSGQFGDGTTDNHSTPKQIMSDVKEIAAGGGHTLILKHDNTLWVTGDNKFGQLGDGTTNNANSPKQLMSNVIGISAGQRHTLILKEDNSLWACGWNEGQIGDGTTTNVTTPKQIMAGVKAMTGGNLHSLIIKTDNSLWATGNNTLGQLGDGTNSNRKTPTQIASEVRFIAAGTHHTLLLKTDNTVMATGYNAFGTLGDGTTTNRNKPTQISF